MLNQQLKFVENIFVKVWRKGSWKDKNESFYIYKNENILWKSRVSYWIDWYWDSLSLDLPRERLINSKHVQKECIVIELTNRKVPREAEVKCAGTTDRGDNIDITINNLEFNFLYYCIRIEGY